MINANELRRWNLVGHQDSDYANDNDDIHFTSIVAEIGERTVVLYDPVMPPPIMTGMRLTYGELIPIPLTAEWLEKMGWHELGMGFFKPYGEGNPRRQLNWGIDNSIKIMDAGGYVISLAENIQYVHQLQNLYFALTGEELILSHEAIR